MSHDSLRYENCTEITPDCPVEATVYGYYPSIGANTVGAVIFGLCFFVNVYLGWRHKTWTYMVAMSLACLTSSIGYIGRILLNDNPWAEGPFTLQIVLLTFSPAFNAAAIYVMLKHIVLRFGAEWSRIKPKWYPWGFITADILALVMQGSGGGIAAGAEDEDTFEVGDNLMLVGVIWQVLTLAVFGIMIVDYCIRRNKSATPLSPSARETWVDTRFRIFGVALITLYTCILVRCIYRIAELAG
jgi:hypothetical protein